MITKPAKTTQMEVKILSVFHTPGKHINPTVPGQRKPKFCGDSDLIAVSDGAITPRRHKVVPGPLFLCPHHRFWHTAIDKHICCLGGKYCGTHWLGPIEYNFVCEFIDKLLPFLELFQTPINVRWGLQGSPGFCTWLLGCTPAFDCCNFAFCTWLLGCTLTFEWYSFAFFTDHFYNEHTYMGKRKILNDCALGMKTQWTSFLLDFKN